MFIRFFLVVLFLVFVFGGLFGWKYMVSRQADEGPAMGPPPATVAAAEARKETWQPYLSAVGSLSAVSGIQVSSEVAGQVDAIRFVSGQTVAEGDLLLQLDDTTDQAQLKGLVAEQKLAQLKFRRIAQLLSDKTVSQSDYDEARATLDSAAAMVAAQRALIGKKQIRAPFTGRLGIRRVDLGEYLAPGAAIVPLEALDPIYADFSLPERELARIATGQSIEVRVQAYPGEVFPGDISALDPGIERGTRSVRVRATLENPAQRLRPGMFAEIRVGLPEETPVVTVPDTAITFNPYGNVVFVIQEGENGLTVQSRHVETGDQRGTRVAIRSGLAEGDRVVSAGQVKLRNGQAVVIDQKPAPGQRDNAT